MNPELQAILLGAERLERAGQAGPAETAWRRALQLAPGHASASIAVARLATARGARDEAAAVLDSGHRAHPDDTELAIQLGLARAALGALAEALQPLQQAVQRSPDTPFAWLVLSLVHDRLGQPALALTSAYQAVTRAQRAGQWLDQASTPPAWLNPVVQAIERVRRGRRELFLGAYAHLRERHGADALKRMDRALANYLKSLALAPESPNQRPRFFYFPDLPSPAYHDPYLQPWAAQLAQAYPAIRAEALRVIGEDQAPLPDFISTTERSQQRQYLGGNAPDPSWQAFFFYRHGKRYDENHLRCPHTSAVLESIELCRIADQAPEICFSVLRPRTDIKPHHGVTNTRLVMHLPLLVPPDCALSVADGGEHAWREGELVMFDDTFRHEAWNRSDSTRVILLMDCWNPHLTAVEREACTSLIEMISSLKAPGASP